MRKKFYVALSMVRGPKSRLGVWHMLKLPIGRPQQSAVFHRWTSIYGDWMMPVWGKAGHSLHLPAKGAVVDLDDNSEDDFPLEISSLAEWPQSWLSLIFTVAK